MHGRHFVFFFSFIISFHKQHVVFSWGTNRKNKNKTIARKWPNTITSGEPMQNKGTSRNNAANWHRNSGLMRYYKCIVVWVVSGCVGTPTIPLWCLYLSQFQYILQNYPWFIGFEHALQQPIIIEVCGWIGIALLTSNSHHSSMLDPWIEEFVTYE